MPKAETLKIRLPAHEKNTPLLGRETVIIKVPVKKPWNHTAELDYIKPKDWDNTRIITYLLQNGFSISPYDAPKPYHDAYVVIRGRNGEITVLPQGYRTPLMFTAKFQWESLRLVLTSASPYKEWEEYKYDILHLSRLCARFLEEARNALGTSAFHGGWRSKMFDRTLTRYYRRWLVNRPEFLKDFWGEFGEKEYTKDVLQNDWTRFVLKGHKGFRITKEEITNGISFEEFTDGLRVLHEAVTSSTNSCSPVWIIGPCDVMGPRDIMGLRDATLRKQASNIFKAFRTRTGHSSWGHAAADFDLGNLGLHSNIPPSQTSSNPSSTATSLQIKREMTEEPLDLRNHMKHPLAMQILPLEPPQEDAVLAQMHGLSVRDSRVPDHLSFVRRYQRSSLLGERSRNPFPQVLEKIISALVECSPERKDLSGVARDHQSPPPFDVSMDDDPAFSAVNQQDAAVNMAFSSLSTICSPKASSEEDLRAGSLSTGEAGKRHRLLRMSGGKRSRSTFGALPTDVQMMDMVSRPSTETSADAQELNKWDLNLESRAKYYLELARKMNDSEGRRIDQHILTDVAFAKAGPRPPITIAEIRRASSAKIQTIASTSLKGSMFQQTSGLILESKENENEDISPPSEQSSKAVSPFVSDSSSQSTKPDATLVSELLDEIKGLKRLLHENSASRLERDADVKRLRTQMNDLHHTFVYQQSLRGMSAFSPGTETQNAISAGGTPRDCTPRSQHPLAHLLSAEADVLGESLSFSHILVEAGKQEGLSTLSTDEPQSLQPLISGLITVPPPHDDVPLPVKSQRKHRILFPDHAILMG